MLDLETLTKTFISSLSICAIGKMMRKSTITYCNREERKILQDRNSPLALWSLVLQRTDTIQYYSGSHSTTSGTPPLSVYSLLQEGPGLFFPRDGASTPAVPGRLLVHGERGNKQACCIKVHVVRVDCYVSMSAVGYVFRR